MIKSTIFADRDRMRVMYPVVRDVLTELHIWIRFAQHGDPGDKEMIVDFIDFSTLHQYLQKVEELTKHYKNPLFAHVEEKENGYKNYAYRITNSPDEGDHDYEFVIIVQE